MQIIFLIVKKLVMALCILYTINIIVTSSGIIIPINLVSIFLTASLGLPAVIGLFVLQKMM